MKKPCIYCIKVDNYIAYIGKSIDFESRLQNHWYNLFKSDKNKYLLLKSALFRKHSLSFWIIGEYKEEELDEKEQMWIHLLQPCLNSTFNHRNGEKLDANTFYHQIFFTTGMIEGEQKVAEVQKVEGHYKLIDYNHHWN